MYFSARSVTGKTQPPLNKYDGEVIDYMYISKSYATLANRHILIAGAMGIVEYKDRSLLSENEGPIALDRSWAESF